MSDLFDEDGQLDREEVYRRIRSGVAVLIAVGVLIGGGIFAGSKIYDKYIELRTVDDYIGEGKADIQVAIPTGSTGAQIGAILVEKDVVRSTKAFNAALRRNPSAASIQAGTYKMKTQVPAKLAVEMLLNPDNRVVRRVTIPEGMRYTAMVETLAKGTGIPKEDYLAQLQSPGSLGLPPFANNNPEGFLFPSTYEIPEKADAGVMLKQMTTQYAQVSKEMDIANRAAGVEGGKLSEYDIIKIASIIEAEVRRDEDRPKVARAIYNRLFVKDMPLQVDTTINYSLNRAGHANLPDGETARNTSPYNLYKYKGLPPTPISNPGRKSIEAALNPADGDWLYWVSVNLDTGETKFGITEEEHKANTNEYRAWCKANPGKCTS
ncbi:MAG: endolytic transglycosylase MltG [Actinomycetia bacterium]|nr:endolytic transglycosylase MltG [Actinomycetes bacterium]